MSLKTLLRSEPVPKAKTLMDMPIRMAAKTKITYIVIISHVLKGKNHGTDDSPVLNDSPMMK